MLRFFAVASVVLTLASGIGLLWLIWRGAEPGGIDDAWTVLFGPPDLGPVDFATLERRRSPNDALVCRGEECPKAKADRAAKVYPVPGERLRAIVREVALAQPGVEPVFSERWADHDRYVARTRIMRYPDTIDVAVFGLTDATSTLALYSRSQIGRSDLGANRARLDAWLAAIDAGVARPQP